MFSLRFVLKSVLCAGKHQCHACLCNLNVTVDEFESSCGDSCWVAYVGGEITLSIKFN